MILRAMDQTPTSSLEDTFAALPARLRLQVCQWLLSQPRYAEGMRAVQARAAIEERCELLAAEVLAYEQANRLLRNKIAWLEQRVLEQEQAAQRTQAEQAAQQAQQAQDEQAAQQAAQQAQEEQAAQQAQQEQAEPQSQTQVLASPTGLVQPEHTRVHVSRPAQQSQPPRQFVRIPQGTHLLSGHGMQAGFLGSPGASTSAGPGVHTGGSAGTGDGGVSAAQLLPASPTPWWQCLMEEDVPHMLPPWDSLDVGVDDAEVCWLPNLITGNDDSIVLQPDPPAEEIVQCVP